MQTMSRRSRANRFVSKRHQGASSAASYSPMAVAGSSSDFNDIVSRSFTSLVPLSNATPFNEDIRSAKFSSLQEVLLTLVHFPSGDSFHLDADVALKASDFLGFLAENIDIAPPLFFPQDGDAAVFTWDLGNIKRLLTVDSEELSAQDIHKKSFMRCRHAFANSDYYSVMQHLGAKYLPSSSVAEGDVQ